LSFGFIRTKDGNRVFDYHNDIDLLDRLEVIELKLCWYNRIKGQHMYNYDLTDHNFIQLEVVIAVANLSYNNKNDTYKLEENDYKILKILSKIYIGYYFHTVFKTLYFLFSFSITIL